MELFMNQMNIHKILRQYKKEFKIIKIIGRNWDGNYKNGKKIRKFFSRTKTETIRLLKEIVLLQKEKDKIKYQIETCFDRLNKLVQIIVSNKDYYKTTNGVRLGDENESRLIEKNKNMNMDKHRGIPILRVKIKIIM